MASYLSEAAQFNTPQAPGDLNLINQTLAINQQKYDLGEQAYRDNLSQLKVQEGLLLRPEDRDRFARNVQGLIDEVNSKESGINWAQRGLTNKINSYTKQALDDYTIEQIGISQQIRTFQATGAEKQKKNDGTYADQNYAYAQDQAGVKDYLLGKTDSIGNLQYTNYTDYHKELKDIAENLDKYDHNVKQQVRDGKGYFITREGKELTAQDLKQKTYMLLSDGAKKQMQIDGYATYDVGETEEQKFANVKSKFTEFRTAQEKEDIEKLTVAEGLLKNNPTNKEYVEKVESYKQKVNKNKSVYDDIEKNKSAMYTTMYTENVVGGFANAFAINEVYETLSTDQAYWNQADLNYKINKDALEAASKVKTTFDDIQSKFTPQPTTGQSSSYDNQQNVISSLQESVDSKANDIYSTLPPETQKAVDTLVTKSNGKITRDGAISSLGKDSSVIKLADIMELNKSRNALLNEKTIFNTYVNQVKTEAVKSIATPQFVQKMYANPNIKVLAMGKDGKEHLYPAKDVLEANGVSIKDGKMVGDFSSKPNLLDIFNKSILADKSLSTTDPMDYYDRTSKLATMLGENINTITIKGNVYNRDGTLNPNLGKLDPNSKTAKFLETHRKKGGDNSFNEVVEADNLVNFDVRKRVDDLLSKDRNLGLNKSFMIGAGTDTFKNVARQIGDDVKTDSGTSLKLTLIPDQPNMVRVSQLQEGEKGAMDTKIAELRIQDLPPEVVAKINFNNTRQAVTTKNIEHIKSNVIYTSENNKNKILDLQETVLRGNPTLAYLTTKSGVMNSIFNDMTLSDVVGTVEAPTQTGQLVQKVLEDKNIQVALVPNGARFFVEISRKEGDKNTIILQTPDPVDDSNIESVNDMITYAPQIYIANMLKSAVTQKKLENGSNVVLDQLTSIYGK